MLPLGQAVQLDPNVGEERRGVVQRLQVGVVGQQGANTEIARRTLTSRSPP